MTSFDAIVVGGGQYLARAAGGRAALLPGRVVSDAERQALAP